MPVTYQRIATTTLSTSASSITFSSIPGTYTDLRLVLSSISTLNFNNIFGRINGDTGTNYSITRLIGSGSTATSSRRTNDTWLLLNSTGTNDTIPILLEMDFMSYAGSTNKTILSSTSEDINTFGGVIKAVHLWRNTAAINEILLFLSGGNFSTGTTATIYGILRA